MSSKESFREDLKEWTVMFYLATDNPLAPGVVTHLKAMKSAGYHPQVNVIAQFDPHGGDLPIHIFDVNRLEKLSNPDKVNIGFEPKDSYVRNLVTDKLWDLHGNERIKKAVKKRLDYEAPIPPKTMGTDQDPKRSVQLFLDFCRTRYPARHYMLFLLGHGEIVGGDIFLFDENARKRKNGDSGPHSLLLKDLAEILTSFKNDIAGEGELELLGFHACSMSGAEVAYELRNTANYMLAAQGPTYIGSWPYRQVLIRLFNELGSSPFSEQDLKTNGLLDRIKTGDDKTSTFMRKHFNGNGNGNGNGDGHEFRKLGSVWDTFQPGTVPPESLVRSVANRFSHVLDFPDLYLELKNKNQSPEITRLIRQHKRNGFEGEYLNWLNGRLLLQGLPNIEKKTYTKANIRKLLLSVYYYCLFNSLDFQLAGYSGDLTLCDLRQVGTIREPVRRLVRALKTSLKVDSEAKKQVVRNLLVVAHWEAQSFYAEKYTDLYDFCFCLKRRCKQTRPPSGMAHEFKEIKNACDAVMKTLRRGSPKHDDGVIVRCEYIGPAYQYAHGLSVFFPWSEPFDNSAWENEYPAFSFSAATGWTSFLKLYFKETMRAPQEEEGDQLDRCALPRNLSMDLLHLLEDMSVAKVFNDDGSLKIGSKDPLGGLPVKVGSIDPQGDDCDCGSIKNYPIISHRRDRKRFRGHRTMAAMYHSYKRSYGNHRH